MDTAYIKAMVLSEIEANPTAFDANNFGESSTARQIIAAQERVIKRLHAEKESWQAEIQSLGATVKQQRNFIGKVIHEASSHVRFIFFNLEKLFQFKYTPEKESEYGSLLYTIKENTQRHKILLRNLTDFSSNEYGSKIIVKMEAVPVDVCIQEILDEYSSFSAAMGYPLHMEWLVPPFEAILDSIRFRQVVHNLILNATKHGEKGLITMVINSDALVKNWSLAITNSYLPYSQTENYRNAHLRMGLPICEEVMIAMNGRIESQQTEDLYTVVISMPLPVDPGVTQTSHKK